MSRAGGWSLFDFVQHDQCAIDEEAKGRKEDSYGNGREDFVHHSSHVIPKMGFDCQALYCFDEQKSETQERPGVVFIDLDQVGLSLCFVLYRLNSGDENRLRGWVVSAMLSVARMLPFYASLESKNTGLC